MPYRILRIREADEEFLALPDRVQIIFEEAVQRMRQNPLASGPGYQIDQLTPPQGVVHPVWAVHVGSFRGLFILDGQDVIFGGFGPRPGFYRKLSRVKSMIRRRSRFTESDAVELGRVPKKASSQRLP